MRHLRFVHNAQTLLSLLVVYLVLSSWTSGTELLDDLDGFIQTTQLARGVVDRPASLELLVPSVREARDRRDRELSEKIGHRVAVTSPSIVRSMTSLPSESASIGLQWTEFQSKAWILKEVDLSQHDFFEVRDWFVRWNDRWGYCRYVFERDRRSHRDRSAPRFSYNDIRRSITPDIRILVSDLKVESNVVAGRVEAIAYLPESRNHISCRRLYNRWDYMRDEEWKLSIDRESFGPYEFEVRTQTVRIPPSTFERFPHLQNELTSIQNLTPYQVRERATMDRIAELQERESRLFGTTIRGEDLGVVAPLAILVMHLYLLITLLSVSPKMTGETQEDDFLPWLAAMKSRLAISFAWTTLALFPAAAAGLALWRLAVFGPIMAIVCSLALLMLGTVIVSLAQNFNGESATAE